MCDPSVTRCPPVALLVLAGVVAVLTAFARPAALLAQPGGAARMMVAPPQVLRVCRSSPFLRSFCPRRLPYVTHLASEPAYLVSLCRVGRPGCAGLTWDDLELEHVGEGSRPPAWAHVGLASGRIIRSKGLAFRWPAARHPAAPRNGLFAASRRKALFLGTVRWRSRSGQLVLAPSYPAGGMMGDHLIFYWRAHGRDQMISLHGWEPFMSTVATLRAVVLSPTD